MNEQRELFDTQSDYRERILDAVKGYHRQHKHHKRAGPRKDTRYGITGARSSFLVGLDAAGKRLGVDRRQDDPVGI